MCIYNVSFDVMKSVDIIQYNIKSKKYNSIYSGSNEEVNRIISNVDVCGKNVLTVLSSGDQAFHLYNKGAKSVDLFDINKLTFYYYYLRMWCIKYFNSFYLEDYGYRYISKLLKIVKPSSNQERLAYDYWVQLFEKVNSISNLLEGGYSLNNEISDLNYLKTRIDLGNTNFNNIDISKKMKIRKKYDIIYTSNISDWILQEDRLLHSYMNNLYGLLKKNGVILCSTFSYIESDEFELFSDKFNCELFTHKGYSDNSILFGYSYKKK